MSNVCGPSQNLQYNHNMCILLESPSLNVCFNQFHLGSSGSFITTVLLYFKYFAPNNYYAGVAITKMLKIIGRTMRSS